RATTRMSCQVLIVGESRVCSHEVLSHNFISRILIRNIVRPLAIPEEDSQTLFHHSAFVLLRTNNQHTPDCTIQGIRILCPSVAGLPVTSTLKMAPF
ncbi:MAG: hypothetical protein ACYSU3_22620, partial [Planctomycetota bacterium]